MIFSNQAQEKVNTVFKKYEVKFAYLFGSRATGKANKNSDYDFAVMLPREISADERFNKRLKMIGEVVGALKNNKVDLIVLNDTRSVLLKFAVIYEGKVIYDKDHDDRVDFEVMAMNYYYDFSPFLNAYNKAYLKRELAKN
jgi:predicted nucleotidyltransferase